MAINQFDTRSTISGHLFQFRFLATCCVAFIITSVAFADCQLLSPEQFLKAQLFTTRVEIVSADLTHHSLTFKNHVGDIKTWSVSRTSFERLSSLRFPGFTTISFEPRADGGQPKEVVLGVSTTAQAPCQCVGGQTSTPSPPTCTGHCEGSCAAGTRCALTSGGAGSYGFFCGCIK